jgi:pimeloyl-ACP methyl ester carboxylesterase
MEDEQMTKLICFSGVEAPGGVEDHGEYRVYWAVMDGELCQVKVLKERSLTGGPGYAVWPGLYACTFNDDGFIERIRVPEDIITGYSINAPEDGKIVLGVEESEYRFVPGAPVYQVENPTVIRDYKLPIEDLKTDWNDNYFLKLNDDGMIEEMYVFKQGGEGENPLLSEIKKFKIAQSALEYTYYQPPSKQGVKYPLFVWFHGLHGGTSVWTSHFEFNPIANWASDGFQSRFKAGGAYIMVPRAYEDLRDGHGISWNPWHVGLFLSTLDDFFKAHPDCDRERVYIAGYSMGGYMTWLAAKNHPERFAAAVPCCSSGQVIKGEQLKRVAKLPFWAIHCQGDMMPLESVTRPMQALMDLNPLSRLLVLPSGFKFPDGSPTIHNHLVWIPVLNDLLYNDNTPYSDNNGVPVASTLIEWLNAVK